MTENGQGIIEYAVILLIVAVIVIIVLSSPNPAIANLFQSIYSGVP